MAETDDSFYYIFVVASLLKTVAIIVLLWPDYVDDGMLWFVWLQTILAVVMIHFLFYTKTTRKSTLLPVSIIAMVLRTLSVWFTGVLWKKYEDNDISWWFLAILVCELVISADFGNIFKNLLHVRVEESDKKSFE